MREAHAFIQLAENKRQRAGKNTGETLQFITCAEQVLQVFNYRQACAHVGVVEEFTPVLRGGKTQLMVVIHRRGVGLFVRRNHMEAFAQEISILIRHRLA
ncbi:hypothetical protein SDC9_180620 [bioreactor metagenome]|uniref:Uncharacterized protein n=1 Tax=bioreactor metagenome TaxID=1076179 RepID=A0A645H289_9ZZZZ